jgi:transposase
MAMGRKRARQKQEEMFYASERAEAPGHPFYEQLNGVLDDAEFDRFCEEQCRDFYHQKLGRPSLAPGVYFRLLLIGFFEGIGSERGIAWRVADSFSLRRFLKYGLDEATPDHVTISRTRRLLDEETHQAAFTLVLTEVARRGMLKGKTIGIDATSLEANAAMRSIVRRDTGESYMEYLRKLAQQAGIDSSDDEAVRRMDRKRKKKTPNEEWVNPHDPEAEVTKMKDGTTHLAYKAEQAVDLETGVIVAITTHGGATGDSESVRETLPAAGYAVAEQIDTPTAQGSYEVHEQGLCEVVTDKGYHSGPGLAEMSQSVRTYVSVPQQPRRNWKGKAEQQAAVYANRRRVGVSSQGHMIQSVRDRPRPTDSGLVAGEVPWRESKTVEPSDEHTRKECAQRTRLQRAVNADVASLRESPVAETVHNARKQQEFAETSPMRQLSPAGYQRRHGVKDDVETGEALGARRRNFVEEMPAITVSGKRRHRYQGDGSGRSTVDGRAAKRARREGPGPVSIPSAEARQG